jgi:hypothetical protein
VVTQCSNTGWQNIWCSHLSTESRNVQAAGLPFDATMELGVAQCFQQTVIPPSSRRAAASSKTSGIIIDFEDCPVGTWRRLRRGAPARAQAESAPHRPREPVPLERSLSQLRLSEILMRAARYGPSWTQQRHIRAGGTPRLRSLWSFWGCPSFFPPPAGGLFYRLSGPASEYSRLPAFLLTLATLLTLNCPLGWMGGLMGVVICLHIPKHPPNVPDR